MTAASDKATEIFAQQKKQILSAVDQSRKGSIDAPIVTLVDLLNDQPEFVTTSSCSGRTCVYEQDPESSVQKKGCRWLLVEHGLVTAEQVLEAMRSSTWSSFIKFEAFVLHVMCGSLRDAQNLHAVAVASGFRNSGITISNKGKVVVYVQYVCQLCNEKMAENLTRIERFHSGVKSMILNKNKTKENTKKHHQPAERHEPHQLHSVYSVDQDIEHFDIPLTDVFEDSAIK